MAKSIPSHATPAILKWARESARLSIAEVSEAEQIDESLLKSWENGEEMPSFAKLKKLAARYKRPLFVFYLAEKPKGFSLVKDYRTLPPSVSKYYSQELISAIRSAQERQAWAASYLEQSGSSKITVVRKGGSIKHPHNLAAKIRQKLGISIQSQSQCDSSREALNLWKNASESIGVFVFQAPKVNVQEMRGFALPNAYAPVVVLNSKDTYSARVFTLIHELAHLARNESAVTGSGNNLFSPSPDFDAESFCNQVAAEVLVPAEDFRIRVPRGWEIAEDKSIQELANFYRVSRAVIVFRLVEFGFAKEDFLKHKLRQYAYKETKRTAGPIPRPQLAEAYNGRAFSRLAISAYYSGDIHGGSFTKLIDLNLKHLAPLEARLYPNRVQSLLDVHAQ